MTLPNWKQLELWLNTIWTPNLRRISEETETRRILYLCKCGYDHQQRTTKYDRLERDEPGSQQRHTPVPFTGCLAHAELTVRANKILRIRGHFEHNEECKTANLTSFPPIPVHPSVYVVALAQLRDGATFSDIRQKNRDLFDTKAYAGFPPDLESSPHRWLLTSNDSRSLYRQYNRMKGVSVICSYITTGFLLEFLAKMDGSETRRTRIH
ncbi:hypothetical protein B0H14DRAFT_2502266 [Mycena olivaceomarginata]|nr:hypothetical protein B0H14DRAFT_2502266 [Mycena olivaceomarginata]